VYTHYLYDGAGIRVKKLVRKQGGNYEATVYVDGIFEHHRSVQVDGVIENNSLHVMDNQQRIALVRIGPPFPDDLSPAVKFHLGDHLGSSNLVIDGSGSWIQREEFTPYGESSFGGFARKRYRYTGKERNEESGLNYHGARYYSPWLARWLSCDPAGMADGLNIYAYTRNNPLNHVDPDGASSRDGGTAVSSSDVNGTPPTPEELGPSRAIPQRSEVAGYVNEANPTYSQLDDCFSVSNGPPLLTEERLKYMGGTLYGTLQSIPFGGDLAPSPLPNDYTFEFARGSAQAATGVAMMAGGTGGIVGGGGLSATGAGAVVGVPTLAVSGAALIKGTMSVAASTQTLAHANTLRRSGSNGSSTAGLRSGPSAAVEERFMPKKYRVNMKKAPLSSPRTAEGWQRNSKWFWRELSASNPELFSASNQALIKEGLAPVVDDVWLKYHPEHQLYEGDFLVHHHIEGGQWAAGIPRAFHQLFHGPLHY
jgi:RHS repeat-associated protein